MTRHRIRVILFAALAGLIGALLATRTNCFRSTTGRTSTSDRTIATASIDRPTPSVSSDATKSSRAFSPETIPPRGVSIGSANSSATTPANTSGSAPNSTSASRRQARSRTGSPSGSSATGAGTRARASVRQGFTSALTSGADGSRSTRAQAFTSAVGSDTTTDLRDREAVAFPIQHDLTEFRRNLILNANADLPVHLWANPQFLALDVVRAEGGTFPVRLWRRREDDVTFWREVRVGAHQEGYLPVGLDGAFFRAGDVLLVEITLPLMVRTDDAMNTLTPLMSVVDNRNGDAYTAQGRRVPFRGTR